MPCPAALRHIAARHANSTSSSSAPARSSAAQVGLLGGEQAIADLAVGGQPGAVAGRAERVGHRRDDADRRRSAVDQPQPRRRRTTRRGIGRRSKRRAQGRRRSRRPSAPDSRRPLVSGVERHLLDDPQLVSVLAGRTAAVRRRRRGPETGSRTALTFTGPSPAAAAAARPSSTASSRSRRVMAAKCPGSTVSSETLTRSSPAVGQAARPRSPARRRWWSARSPARGCSAAGGGDHVLEPAVQQRLAAGEPDAGDAQPGDREPQQPGQFVEASAAHRPGSQSSPSAGMQ